MTAIGSAINGTPNWVTKPMKNPVAEPTAKIVTLFRTPASSASESAKPAQAIAAASSANNVSPTMSGPPHDSVVRDGPTCSRRNASARR